MGGEGRGTQRTSWAWEVGGEEGKRWAGGGGQAEELLLLMDSELCTQSVVPQFPHLENGDHVELL